MTFSISQLTHQVNESVSFTINPSFGILLKIAKDAWTSDQYMFEHVGLKDLIEIVNGFRFYTGNTILRRVNSHINGSVDHEIFRQEGSSSLYFEIEGCKVLVLNRNQVSKFRKWLEGFDFSN